MVAHPDLIPLLHRIDQSQRALEKFFFRDSFQVCFAFIQHAPSDGVRIERKRITGPDKASLRVISGADPSSGGRSEPGHVSRWSVDAYAGQIPYRL